MTESTSTRSVFRVTETIEGAQRKMKEYPLLVGDLLTEWDDGTFYKFAPGLGVFGFVLTDEQRATLEPVDEIPPMKMVGIAEYLSGGSA